MIIIMMAIKKREKGVLGKNREVKLPYFLNKKEWFLFLICVKMIMNSW